MLVSLIGFNAGDPEAVQALKILFEIIKFDEKVFQRFKPSQAILRKLSLDSIIYSKKQVESDLALDFASFLLRYHRLLYYEEFSDDQRVVSMIKRAETFRAWADIEDISLQQERMMNTFSQHQQSTHKAFYDLRNYTKATKDQISQQIVKSPAP